MMTKSEGRRSNLKHVIANHKEIFRFLVLLICFLGLAFRIFYLLEPHLNFLRVWTAQMTVFLSTLLGMEAHIDGSSVVLQNMTFEIVYECTGIIASLIYLCFVVAYPTS